MTDISKLPKWAQSEIERLQRDNTDLRRKLDEIQDGSGPMVWYEIMDGVTHGIPDGAVVRAQVGGEKIEISVQGDALRISSIMRSIIVQPQSANVVRVRVADYW